MRRQNLFIFPLALLISCISQRNITAEKTMLKTSPGNENARNLEVEFIRGEAFNHPSFAIWTEDLYGNLIETLYVTQFVATGKFGHGELESGKWKNEPGEVRRPSTLPYWAHKRNIKAPDGLFIPSLKTPVPDAITAATPTGNFVLRTSTSLTGNEKFRVLMEINQAWDSNKYWTNAKYPNNLEYFTSLQPAIVYAVTIDPEKPDTEYYLNPIGHSHPWGENGELYTDLTTLTTAKEIAQKIIARLK